MRQVWLTEDGKIFDKKEDAEQHVAKETSIRTFTHKLSSECPNVYEADAREIAEWLLDNFYMEPKT